MELQTYIRKYPDYHISNELIGYTYYSEPFSVAMGTLSSAYEEKFGCYIYDHDYGELKTLDAWVREMEPDKPYYAGAVMDYKA